MTTKTELTIKIKANRVEVLTKREVSIVNAKNALKSILNRLNIKNSVEHLN